MHIHINPVYKKELKMMARSPQLPVLVVIFNIVLAIVAVIALYCIDRISFNNGTAPYKSMMTLYIVLLTMVVCLLCLFVPSTAGGSIAGERERQTLDILLASKMTVREIIFGKLLSCISMAILLVVSSLPVLSVVMMYGGISPVNIYQSVAYTGFLILMIGCIGVFCSCRFGKTTFASVSSYAILIFLTAGTGLLILMASYAVQVSVRYESGGSVGPLTYLWLLNPAMTYIVIIFQQLNDAQSLYNLLNDLGVASGIVDNWLIFSLVAQCAFILILLELSVRYLDPLDERFQTGRKILKKHKRK